MPLFKKPTRWAAAAACALAAVAALPTVPAGAATAAGAPPVPERYRHQRLDWHPCASGSLECATMAVPRDWYHPDAGPDLRIEVSRRRAADASKRRGVLMMAAGGPGASGLGRPARLASYSPKLAEAYDIVSFDQRGVGASTRIVCSDQDTVDAFFGSGDLRDRSGAAVRQTFDRARGFVRDCVRNSGGLLPYITTDQAVHDMDLYRELLGEERISYFGPSYATFLGAYYATEFPRRVERVVLDSNIDFTGTWQSFLTGQPLSFQRRFEQDFLPWLAKNDTTYHQGRTPAEAKANYERLRAALHDHPLDIDGTVITPNHLDAAATDAIYNARQFGGLAALLGVLAHPDEAPAETRAAVARSFRHLMEANFFADFFAVTCGDTPWNRDSRYWVEQSAEATYDHPLAGARELTFASICANWPRSKAPRIKVTGEGLPPVLMLNSTNDPATYYEAAVRAHRGLAGSRLITVNGGDHGQFQNDNACVDAHVEAYLLNGTLPAGDTGCPGAPVPDPTPPHGGPAR
ncbi:alpha/beta hydrolase [Streptomyces sp. ISL-86]|uniref:alpha/beta hydrolase n=1 Tax=Streptomyces sp. ISL-86 TaxID=2819187 RepID=UPI001BE58661|nr:alpha/beta hydrolase [Streptomyces sp. ISL-86]MBT2455603.1 alpha/beta fold hydrolase [Streptomyces sp. ISL-86]